MLTGETQAESDLFALDEINEKRARGCLPSKKRRTLCCGGPSRRMSSSDGSSVVYEEFNSTENGDYTSVTGTLAHDLIPPKKRPGCLDIDSRTSVDTVAINAFRL